MISWSLQLLRILKKKQQGKAIRKKEKRPYLDEDDSLMHGRTVTAPQQIASGVIKQARSVENLQGLSRDCLSFFSSTGVHYKPSPCNENRYSLCPFLAGKTYFSHRENLLSLQGSCSHCTEPVFKTGGSLHAPCSTLYRIAVQCMNV